MKKKYLALIMACILCTSAFVTGCGRTADVIEDDDDRDDDDDDDDDDKDDDDKNDKEDEVTKPVYVESIEPAAFLEQVKLFVKNKSIWSVSDDTSASISEAGYAVTDLDHNGRAELIVMTSYASNNMISYTKIYEINENGTGFHEAEWEFSGLDVSDTPGPDLLYYPYPLTYYDEKTGISHYLALEYYDDGNSSTGVCYDDLTYSEGAASNHTYAASRTYEYYDITTDSLEYEYTYTTEEGEVTETQYYDYRFDYAGGLSKLEECYLGVYRRAGYGDHGVMSLNDEFLRDVLFESYRVFSGYQSFSVFEDTYNDTSAGTGEVSYDRCIGTWNVWASEVDGEWTYYGTDSPAIAVLEISEDYTVTVKQYRDGVLSLQYTCDVYFDNGLPYFDYGDRSALPEGFMMERYTIAGMDEECDGIFIYLDFYGEDGILGTTTLFCELIPPVTERIESCAGKWVQCSSEVEGDFSTYDPDTDNVNYLEVRDDNTMIITEYNTYTEKYETRTLELETDLWGNVYAYYYFPKNSIQYKNGTISHRYDLMGLTDEGMLELSVTWEAVEYMGGATWLFIRE